MSLKNRDLRTPIGIFGGTFDPIHFGHLRIALELLEQTPLAEIRFILCPYPPHRQIPIVSPETRLAMLKLATITESRFIIDSREFNRSAPSYTFDTLISLREEIGEKTPLCLILGTDAFQGLSKWYQWKELINLTHFIVVKRPKENLYLESELKCLVAGKTINDPLWLMEKPIGYILFTELTQLDISASQIRNLIKKGKNPRYLLPNSVWEYIQQRKLYSS
ncbi:nicotinate-nucleotide adenylyltransferase [Candidatus Nitrosacidococcus tergens]|uniref:Probable nicotinate-nucleotide adenylyltransferase n=1 Tax=Candidatus Nitrosacidococcus tergens TaxID=553981 RepID=A0A7G1QB35_9GAMM|nr:nicotinate-nucleotide adenylyltransferase [Candidatus Nitrosacidococcus tergens]CAB1277124.1 putative nicotinate-nucleotide adenylyltransferase [Candidatus Nitrosacidococcus tergens]